MQWKQTNSSFNNWWINSLGKRCWACRRVVNRSTYCCIISLHVSHETLRLHQDSWVKCVLTLPNEWWGAHFSMELLVPKQALVTPTDLRLPDIRWDWTEREERECMMNTWLVLLCTAHMLNVDLPLKVFQQLTVHIPCRRYKQYKPIERSTEQTEKQEGFTAYFSTFKAIFFPNSTERNPLLKSKPGIV